MTTLDGETTSQLHGEFERSENDGLAKACANAEAKYGLPAGLLLAVASRETHCSNIVGDYGHGRGYFQIDDRWHHDWLSQHGAGGPGQVPPMQESAYFAAHLISEGIKYARSHGVPAKDALRVALSGYNAGMARAVSAYHNGNTDSPTTHHNYSHDVLARQSLILKWLPKGGSPTANGPAGVGASAAAPGRQIRINPTQLRRAANLLGDCASESQTHATNLAHPSLPTMPASTAAVVAAELDSAAGYLRSIAHDAQAWAVDLRKRADLVDTPPTTLPKPGAPKGPGTHPVLQIGSHGSQVSLLQQLLNRLGYGPLAVDGAFGPMTRAALERYQRDHHLLVDGVAGPQTWGSLLGRPQKPAPPHPGGGGGGGGAAAPPATAGGLLGELAGVARGQWKSGYTAGYDYNESNKYSAWAGRGGSSHAEAWCADFVSWCFAHAGHPVGPGGKGFSLVSGWVDYFQRHDKWHPHGPPVVGAVVAFDWSPSDGRYDTDHVGIVSRIADGRVYYISGNTHDPGGSGHVGVYEKSVPLSCVLGYGY